jgi:hypothetical protein
VAGAAFNPKESERRRHRRLLEVVQILRQLSIANPPQSQWFLAHLRAIRQALQNLGFSRRETLGWSSVACHAPRLTTAAFLASPNYSWVAGQTASTAREEKRGVAPLDSLGHIRLKRIELQIELSRDSGQTDLAIETWWGLAAAACLAKGFCIGGRSLGILQSRKKQEETTDAS